ncbi:MAG TPA: hypothetical protein PK710_20090, partial [Polyangiaceae bacterium]|nr:hypothetical protein [Polyangiaceae bacterium]
RPCAPIPSALRPYPVGLAHGRSGSPGQMKDIINALQFAGHCVFGEEYGKINGKGQTGMAHLNQSGAEFAAVVDKVLKKTGAKKVNVVGYSEGGMVIDNYILAKGGASKVNRMVGFAPGHHPYAHLGLSTIIDGIVFCPNTMEAVHNLLPPFTSNIKSQDIVAAALGLASFVGQHLSPADQEIVESDFAADLFDANYWISLHGGLSEPPGHFLMVGQSERSLPTNDSAPEVCYTNLISPLDMMVGASAGFLDEGPNVSNIVLPSTTDHVTVIEDKVGIATMLLAFETPCNPTPKPDPEGTEPQQDDDTSEAGVHADGGTNDESWPSEENSTDENDDREDKASVADGGSPPDDHQDRDHNPSNSPSRHPMRDDSQAGCACASMNTTSTVPDLYPLVVLLAMAGLRRRRAIQ